MNKQELQSLLEGVRTALTGNQSKLDRNQNNKIDREDFTLLRSKKKPMAENADLLALLEHLYGVLLDQKAARLNEWEQPNSASHRWVKGAQANAKRGQTSDPTNFYQSNRADNDEIRMSIVRAAAEEERKKKEQERLRGAQMENAEYDSILEKIYTALTEADAPPDYPQPPATWPRDKNGDLIDWPWPHDDNPPGWVLPNDRKPPAPPKPTIPLWGPNPNGNWGARPSWWPTGNPWPPVPPFTPYNPTIPNSPFEIRPDYIRPQWKPIVPNNQAD